MRRARQNHHKGACPLRGGGALGEEFHGGVVGGVFVGVVERLKWQQGRGLHVAAALEGAAEDENERYLRAQYYIETHLKEDAA